MPVQCIIDCAWSYMVLINETLSCMSIPTRACVRLCLWYSIRTFTRFLNNTRLWRFANALRFYMLISSRWPLTAQLVQLAQINGTNILYILAK